MPEHRRKRHDRRAADLFEIDVAGQEPERARGRSDAEICRHSGTPECLDRPSLFGARYSINSSLRIENFEETMSPVRDVTYRSGMDPTFLAGHDRR